MAGELRNYRAESRQNYGRKYDIGEGATKEDLNTGALLRIADATEKMAVRHTELMANCEWYERRYRDTAKRATRLEHQLRAAKGHVTRLRKKLAQTPPHENAAPTNEDTPRA